VEDDKRRKTQEVGERKPTNEKEGLTLKKEQGYKEDDDKSTWVGKT